jgi:putative DNA primase/helicase
VTGIESGLVVVDIDDHDSTTGSHSLREIEESIGEEFDSLTAITGQGRHLYFNHPGAMIPCSAGKLAAGIDVRGDGGYIVAPPSLHESGTAYRWVDPDDQLCDLPETIVRVMRSGTSQDERLEIDSTEQVYEGERNDRLYRYGSALRGNEGLDRGEVLARLISFNDSHCEPPLDESEVISIAENACKYPAEHKGEQSSYTEEGKLLPWFQFDTLTWLSDPKISAMSDTQVGHYILLKVYAWNAGGYLPDDIDQLARLARAKSRQAFEKGKHLVLAEYKKIEIDGEAKLVNPQMAATYNDKRRIVISRKKAGKAGAEARWKSDRDVA